MMCNNFTNINKMNNYLSPQIIEHKKDHNICMLVAICQYHIEESQESTYLYVRIINLEDFIVGGGSGVVPFTRIFFGV